jgi:glutamate 5-kinase
LATKVKRIVVKTGSQVLCDEGGALSQETLASLAGQICTLREDGWEVVLVSSGAVAAGAAEPAAARLKKSDPVRRRQVLAATGQVRLMQTWQALFAQHEASVAQVLASKSDFQSREHYLNMRNCMEGILAAGIVPIVNENDVVSITELMFTDNDELAGLLAGMVNADLLCLLSTVEGVFDSGQVISTWNDAQHTLEQVVGSGTSRLGRGGMHSKLSAARKAASLGTEVVIANGREADILMRIVSGQPVGTRFIAGHATSPAKRWLASANEHAVGAVRVNEGAAAALRDRRRLASLLPVGIERCEGSFQRGDVILIMDPEGRVIGCGRSQYDREEADHCIGQRDRKALIHYDYLYLNE